MALRKQPEEVRTHILHVLVIISAVFLMILWTYGLGTNLANPETQTSIEEDLRPFSVLKDNLIGGYNSIRESTPPVIE